ncbi:hypothetical protein MAPG_09235 [Magnaporthiopsis poae ATCC 64411]|uniref:Uncharacterized protein n=1 Tax=Magnaporthiopsis poae (strain ATCC 64411 / 73-15) TaxID=644358 RepID=A0A0C4E9F1_MAGP6|nr:hypothetical protein MAPG_09235 [Magnaporthiopsis poae ATCC 64411]
MLGTPAGEVGSINRHDRRLILLRYPSIQTASAAAASTPRTSSDRQTTFVLQQSFATPITVSSFSPLDIFALSAARMKFTTLVTSFALAGAGIATRIGRRDAATINLALTEVVEKMTLLDAAVLKYMGGSDLTDIAENAYYTVEAIRGASMRVSNTSAADSVAEATGFAAAVERLTITSEGLLTHVVAQTVNFTTSGMCSDVHPMFNEIGTLLYPAHDVSI